MQPGNQSYLPIISENTWENQGAWRKIQKEELVLLIYTWSLKPKTENEKYTLL